MKRKLALFAILFLTGCQTTQSSPKSAATISFNDKGEYVLSSAHKDDVTLPFCFKKDENGKMYGQSEYTEKELVTIIRYGCTPRDKDEAMEKYKKAKALEGK